MSESPRRIKITPSDVKTISDKVLENLISDTNFTNFTNSVETLVDQRCSAILPHTGSFESVETNSLQGEIGFVKKLSTDKFNSDTLNSDTGFIRKINSELGSINNLSVNDLSLNTLIAGTGYANSLLSNAITTRLLY
jgi:hypothetical protein